MLNFGKKNAQSKKDISKLNKKLQEYNILETIGEGTYGKVKSATHISTNETVAIKFIDKKRLVHEGDTQRIQREMKILSVLSHPNILKAFEIFEDEFYDYIVMEKPDNGDLFNYICKKGRLSMDESSLIFYQLINGISYLHKNKIAHRDMKPENILITEDLIIKIGDFGLSKYFKSKNVKFKTNCGSPCYSAPEILRGNLYHPIPADIWGIGIILYCMVCGELPFEDEKEDILIRKVTLCNYNCPRFVNSKLKILFQKILCRNPDNRMTIDEIKMNWFYNLGKANFHRLFKVYGDDGNLLPQVKLYIKQLTLKKLETECNMEINKESEKTTGYKIFFYKIMHKTKWGDYYIPKNNKKCAINNENINLKNSNKKKKYRSKSCNEKENKENDNLLFIPEHELLNEKIFEDNDRNQNIKISLNDKDIDAIRKMGIITHSFDINWEPQKPDISNNENCNNIYINEQNV